MNVINYTFSAICGPACGYTASELRAFGRIVWTATEQKQTKRIGLEQKSDQFLEKGCHIFKRKKWYGRWNHL